MKVVFQSLLIILICALVPFVGKAEDSVKTSSKASPVSLIQTNLPPGIYRGHTPKNESCGISVELQARLWHSQPAISVIAMTEKALKGSAATGAAARFVVAENQPVFDVKSIKESTAELAVEVKKSSQSHLENDKSMKLSIQLTDQGTEVEVTESSNSILTRAKKIRCIL